MPPADPSTGQPPRWITAAIPLFLLCWLVVPLVSASNRSAGPNEPITPIPLSINLPADKLALGERLFNDTKLAGKGRAACATCHVLEAGGDDGLRIADGLSSTAMPLNTPTLFNAAYNGHLGWFGSHASLRTQATADLAMRTHNTRPWPTIIKYLNTDNDYRQTFDKIYPDGITIDNVLDTLTTFERSLITPDSPFDRWLRGDDDALDPSALKGYRRFQELGCISCHQGINIGGNLFQPIGIFDDFFANKKPLTQADQGRFSLTGRERDKHVFRVPSLRNVAVTAPYFHDGRTDSLKEAIALVGRYQLDRELSAQDLNYLLAFLHSLTGSYRGHSLAHE